MGNMNVDLSGQEAQESFNPVAPGWYGATIIDSELKNGSKGPYVSWTFDIHDQPNKVWSVTSLGNDISLKILKTMAVCCGHPTPDFIADSEEFHGMSCKVKLKIEVDETGTYDDKNVISGFKPLPKEATTTGTEPPATPEETKTPW